MLTVCLEISAGSEVKMTYGNLGELNENAMLYFIFKTKSGGIFIQLITALTKNSSTVVLMNGYRR